MTTSIAVAGWGDLDGIWDNSDPTDLALASASLADGVRDILEAKSPTIAIQTFRPTDAAARAALSGIYTLNAGDLALQVDTGVLYRWSGSAWVAQILGGSRVVPTAATNGTVNGFGVVTSTDQSLVRVRDAFPTAFRVFRVTFDVTMSAAAGVLFRLAAGATDAATAYDYQRTTSISTTVATVQDLNQTSGSLSPIGVASRHFGQFLITDPNIAGPSYYRADTTVAPPAAMTTSTGGTSVAGLHRTTTAYNSFSIFGGSGNVTVNRLTVEGVS